MIYRLVLLTQNVTTDVPSANHTCRTPDEGNSSATSETNEVGDGSLRCESWRTYTIGYQISILRANDQIYREAQGIFHHENFWAIVEFNKAGIGKEMKDRGFPIFTGGATGCQVKYPVMKVVVKFPSLKGQNQNDNLVLATVHLSDLVRALRTVKGASFMDVVLFVQPPLTNISPRKDELWRPFKKLRASRRVVAVNAATRVYLDSLRVVSAPVDIDLSFRELRAGIERLQRYIEAGQWERAIAQAENHATFLSDCKVVYGQRFYGIDPNISANVAVSRGNAAKKILIDGAVALANVTLHLDQYANTVLFAKDALANCRVPVYPHVTPAHLAVRSSRDECSILLVRAAAYIGMERSEAALSDMEKVRECWPDCATLVSLSQAWQEKFGPFLGSVPRPAAT